MPTLLSIVEANTKRYRYAYQRFGSTPSTLVIKYKGSVLNCPLSDLEFEVSDYRLIPTVRGFWIFTTDYSIEFK